MSDTDKTVFISYRRSVSAYIARAVFMDLRANGYDVFMDVDSIDSGEFDRIILNQIAARAHFLVILAPGTLERCAEPGDWLRREIEEAMQLQRNIVPLLANNFAFDAASANYLTGKLAGLPKFNALNAPHDYFEAAMERLRTRFLKQPVYGTITPAPAADLPKVAQKQAEMARQPAPTEKQLSAEEYFNRGNTRYDKQDYDGAIADYTEALRLNPQYAIAYNNRGNARKAQGDLDGASADYTYSIELKNPELHLPYNNRGLARYDKKDYDGAIADYNEALRLNPQYAAAYINRGNTRYDKKDYDGAIADYTDALRLNPQYADAYNNRGLARYDKKDYDGAIADYTDALRLNPQYAEAYNNRGIARKTNGDLDGAIADYTRSIELKNPELHLPYTNRGNARYNKQDYDGAIADYNEALRLNPQDANPYWGLGNCEYERQQYSEALRHYERYVQLVGSSPNDFVVKRIAELKRKLGRS